MPLQSIRQYLVYVRLGSNMRQRMRRRKYKSVLRLLDRPVTMISGPSRWDSCIKRPRQS